MSRGNYIDACAVIRRRALEQAGGYAETVSTMEDWDLWLKLASAGWGFVKLELIGFDYRVRQESKQWEILNRPDERRKVFMEVARRHERLFQPWWPTLYNDALDAIVTMEKESKQLAIELEKMKMREHKGASVSAVDQSKPIATPSQVRQRRRSPSRRKSIRPLALTQNRDLNPDGR